MANCYYVNLTIRGKKEVLDEIQTLFQQEIDEGQTSDHWYTMGKTLERMGYDADKLDWRSYTDWVGREEDKDRTLHLRYIGAWTEKPQVIIAIKQRWQVEVDVMGVDEFGQYPITSNPDDVGKYELRDDEHGLEPFDELPEWVSEEEALPVINEYYETDCKTLQEAFDTIPTLEHSDAMELYCEEENDINAVIAARKEE